MYKKGLNIIRVGNKVPKVEDRTVIELTVRGTSFPDSLNAGLLFYINSSVSQMMHIDFNDGTGIHDFPVPNSWGIGGGSGNIMHYYQDLADPSKIGTVDMNYSQERVIQIWFDYPYRVTLLRSSGVGLYGEFPKNIANYALLTLDFTNSRNLVSFPSFRGGIWDNFTLNNISMSKSTTFPSWLGLSRISTLRLQNTFNFSGTPASTNINLISSVDRLRTLILSTNQMGNNSFPTTLKDIPTLENLYVGGNTFTTLPTAITDCTQLRVLGLSQNDGYGYNTTMTSWGAGLGNLTNLTTLIYAVSGASNFPTTVPTGVASCTLLKNITVKSSYSTSQARTDAFVENWYTFIVANASTTSGNTKFRQMVFDMGNIISGAVLRPSGGATPSSLVDPPVTPIEKVYFICKKYAHTWTIRNLSNTGTEVIAP